MWIKALTLIGELTFLAIMVAAASARVEQPQGEIQVRAHTRRRSRFH